MISITLRMVDFMDGRALPGGTIELRLEVVPRFKEKLDNPGVLDRVQRDEPLNIQDEVPLALKLGEATKSGNEIIVLPNFSLAETFDVSGVTDSSGVHRSSFEVDDSFARLSTASVDGNTAEDVVAFLSVGFIFLGFEYKRQYISEPIRMANAHAEHTVPVDFGLCAVGHTTADTTRLWFALNQSPTSGQTFSCVVISRDSVLESELGNDKADPRHLVNEKTVFRPLLSEFTASTGESIQDSLPDGLAIVFDEPVAMQRIDDTALVNVNQLAPATQFHYQLQVHHNNRSFPLMIGMFSTIDPAEQDTLQFSFGSCHLPAIPVDTLDALNASDDQLERWQHLASRKDNEFVMLIGDQIYGDGLEKKWEDQSWFERYRRRYHQLWAYWPMRDVLRRTPNYMILDDHDVADDFGTAPMDGARVAAALEAYRSFQHARNPGGPDGPVHYSFTRGPASFFVVDGRTGRSPDGDRMLLPSQLSDLQAWARSPETLASDVIFLVTPTPIALLPTERIRQLAAQAIKDVKEVGKLINAQSGFVVGAAIGSLLGTLFPGPSVLGPLVLGAKGHEASKEIKELLPPDVERSLLLQVDLAERWDIRENQQQMVQVLDILFNLANGVGDTQRRRRAVFVLGGDIHVGTTHLIRSLPRGQGRQHAANPIITQLTSSAISHTPVDKVGFSHLVSRINDSFSITLRDFSASELWRLRKNRNDAEDLEEQLTEKLDAVLERNPASYVLDSELEKRFATDFSGMLMEHTIGNVGIQRVGPGRRYRFNLGVSGKNESLDQLIEMDLESTAEEIPRFSIGDKRFIRIYLTIQRRGIHRLSVAQPFEGVTVQVMNKGIPDSAQSTEPVVTVVLAGHKKMRQKTTTYVPPAADVELTRAQTDRFGSVWLEAPAQVSAGKLVTVTTETTSGNFDTKGENKQPEIIRTEQTETALTARPDIYFRLILPNGSVVNSEDMPGGLIVKAHTAIGSADAPRQFTLLSVSEATPIGDTIDFS